MGIIVHLARRCTGVATGADEVAKYDSGRAAPTKDDGENLTGAAATKPARELDVGIMAKVRRKRLLDPRASDSCLSHRRRDRPRWETRYIL